MKHMQKESQCDKSVFDEHFIEPHNVDKIGDESKKNNLHRLWFLLLLKNGLRLKGLTNMKISKCVDVVDKKYVIRDVSVTICKGNKPANIVFCKELKKLMKWYLTNKRPSVDNDYVFVGNTKQGNISTSTVRRVFHELHTAVGLTGGQYHPHAMRHVNIQSQSAMGQTDAQIAKTVGHADPAVTTKHYTKPIEGQFKDATFAPWHDDCKTKSKPRVPKDLMPKKKTKKRKINADINDICSSVITQ